MPMIETRDGAWLYVKDWGTGNPVILIHGWPLSSDSWDPIADALANAGHRVIAYDRRGFGRSEQTWNGYDYDRLTDDLADVMEAMGAKDNVTLVGFSMGGGEVARYMSLYQGVGVARAVLIASVVPYMLQTDDNPEGVPQETFDQMTQDMMADRPSFMRSFLHDFFGVGWLTKPVSYATLDWAWRMAMQAGLRPTLKAAEAFATTDFRCDLPAFKVPTLIIHGTADNTVPIGATARAAAAMIEDVTLLEYPGSPHGLLETDRDQIIGDLMAFLNGDTPAAQQDDVFVINPALPMGGY
nr:alpha/beta hydrolase [uncultured Sphingorhabdus sp.]